MQPNPCLRLLMPVSHKRKEVRVVQVQFFRVKRRDATLCSDHGRNNLLDNFLLKIDGVGTSDGHTLNMSVATNGSRMGSHHTKDGIHCDIY